MNFGITPKSMNMIINVLMNKKEVQKAAIFGSRSIGNYKNGSDIDIAIYGANITADLVNEISVELNEKLPLPYYFDIVHYDSLKHDGLKEHIDKYGKSFYDKLTKSINLR
ncbi:nucleotidyltransferase domain-containing protein [Desulfitibacter alkalitolerans]|uniref:nucleotidyltransferase domain-containing protein n=1 Tax=Desulfitibacter alkalitolerans TaxID=264641 RepID=UPI000488015A|nr:nucleotidyltransferase domain-containing protein [Desulfitibacter alkalitolerans]